MAFLALITGKDDLSGGPMDVLQKTVPHSLLTMNYETMKVAHWSHTSKKVQPSWFILPRLPVGSPHK